jgi:hypothetical protein
MARTRVWPGMVALWLVTAGLPCQVGGPSEAMSLPGRA